MSTIMEAGYSKSGLELLGEWICIPSTERLFPLYAGRSALVGNETYLLIVNFDSNGRYKNHIPSIYYRAGIDIHYSEIFEGRHVFHIGLAPHKEKSWNLVKNICYECHEYCIHCYKRKIMHDKPKRQFIFNTLAAIRRKFALIDSFSLDGSLIHSYKSKEPSVDREDREYTAYVKYMDLYKAQALLSAIGEELWDDVFGDREIDEVERSMKILKERYVSKNS